MFPQLHDKVVVKLGKKLIVCMYECMDVSMVGRFYSHMYMHKYLTC